MAKQKVNKKSLALYIVTMVLLVGITATAFVFSPHIFGEQSVFNKPVSNNEFVQTLYGKIPALIRSVQIITIAMLINLVLKLIMSKTIAKSKRGITIVKMLNSFVKWILGIVTVLFVLNAWGVDTATLIASAGLVTLVVGLGAQSLVADIIAGLFIVVEGEYQVGDIVVIDGWRGTVNEIGIRTTKIEDAGGNIKIVNNSEITTIINQTQALSLATVRVQIDYTESLPRVELILKDNIDQMKEHIPAILEGPYYKGVSALGPSGVELLFVARCNEEDIFQVQRDMNRELKLLFDRHNVTIPYTQMVVHQAAPVATKKVGKKLDQSARDFVDDQKDLSQDLDEKQND